MENDLLKELRLGKLVKSLKSTLKEEISEVKEQTLDSTNLTRYVNK